MWLQILYAHFGDMVKLGIWQKSDYIHYITWFHFEFEKKFVGIPTPILGSQSCKSNLVDLHSLSVRPIYIYYPENRMSIGRACSINAQAKGF